RDYLYYYLRSPVFAEYSHTQTIQTVVPHINLGILRDAQMEMRPLPEQRSIARVLGALDDKIELNRRMSATLEEMAWALYRSWFVDFDPVHARALGHPPAHMDATTAALFPDSFGPDSLPKGWEMWSVNDVFEVVMGQSPPGNTYNDDGDGLPFFQGRTDFGFRYPENRKFCSAPSRIAEPESVLLSVRAPVGDLNRAWERCCIGRGVASLSEKAGRTSFGYYAMWSLKAELLSYDSEGTVFGAINKKQLLGLSCVAVPEALRDCFEEIVAPIDSRIRNLTDQSRTLAALRDALLPRLMSGELRIREAQKQVEEAVSA
uniref:restriction endonuclease subunit S n=1 Tax=Pararhodobacter marinus TaxID=2184063 RepID=UPI0035155944